MLSKDTEAPDHPPDHQRLEWSRNANPSRTVQAVVANTYCNRLRAK